MKKILVLALAIVMALSVVAFVACDKGETVTGECKYENTWTPGTYYGAKVDVTVKGGRITAVKLYSDEDTGWTRTSTGWKSKTEDPSDSNHAKETDLGYKAAEAAYEKWIKDTFVGKTVEQVNAFSAKANSPTDIGVETASANLAGATQSAARIICAVQDALSKLGK